MTNQFVCNLGAMTGDQRARYREIRAQLSRTTQTVRELEDGYAFQHPVEMLSVVAEFVDLERLCCPFFRFSIVLEPDSGALWLHLTGDDGVKENLRAELGLSA
jgi:hypothetical protein